MKKSISAGGVVINKNNQVLVVNQNRNSWSLPKGHIDKGEGKIDTAKREIYEESWVTDLKYIRELGNYQRYRIGKDITTEDKSDLKEIHMFLFYINQQDLKPVDSYNPEARWVAKEKVADLFTHPKDKEFFLSIIDKI